MKTSKFFLSTFIAAAAMTSTAFAESTTTVDKSTIYVNSSYTSQETVGNGMSYGENAFGNVSDVKLHESTQNVVIAGGEYTTEGYNYFRKNGGLNISTEGTAILTSGEWAFGSPKFAGEYNVSGSYETTSGTIWFWGDNEKDMIFKVNGATMKSAGSVYFRGGKVVVDSDSSVGLMGNVGTNAQVCVYADVTNYGKMSVDITNSNSMGAAFLVGTDAYKDRDGVGYLYTKYTLSGEKASLVVDSNGKATVDIRVAGQGMMVVEDGAIVTTSGTLEIEAQDANALDANGNPYGGVLEANGGNIIAGTVINNGTLSIGDGSELRTNEITGSGDVVLAGTINVVEGLSADVLTIHKGATLNIGSDVALIAAVSDDGSLSFKTLTIVADDLEGDLDLSTILAEGSTGNAAFMSAVQSAAASEKLVLQNTAGVAYEYTVSEDGKISVVPEPSAFGLLAGLGALALVAARRRRK